MKILKIAIFARRYFSAFRVDSRGVVQGSMGKKLSVLTSGDLNFNESVTRVALQRSSTVMEGGITGLFITNKKQST